MTREQKFLNHISGLRAELENAERHIRKGQLYGAYCSFGDMYRKAYLAKAYLSDKTTKAAQNWGYL